MKKSFLLFLLGLLSVSVYSQNIQVKGTVLSRVDNEVLPGVNITVKGNNSGTITDLNGEFTLSVPSDAILSVSYIGFKEQDVAVNGQSTLRILLDEDVETLDEVVVIGYGVQKKKLLTGANFQVSSAEIQKRNSVNPLQALQGQSPGVSILSQSGQPGADLKVTIRGLGTIGNSTPLYIIDGVQGELNTINPADIESIDVLKDAASAAIYGSQAANGVVLITTKQGKKGKGQIYYEGSFGIQSAAKKPDMLNAEQYMMIMNEQARNSGAPETDFSSLNGLADTDWMDYMFADNAFIQNHTVGISGGSENSSYLMSLNYVGQDGIVGGKGLSEMDKYGFRANMEHKFLDDMVTIGEHLNFSYITSRGVSDGGQYSNVLHSALNTSPLSPVYSDNNKYDSPFNDTSTSEW